MGERSSYEKAKVGRRGFLKTMVAGAVGAGALALGAREMTAKEAEASGLAQPGNHHLAWVWQFDDDGPPGQIRSQLAYIGAGILLKTHDATTWMAKWDKSGSGVDGGARVRQLRDFFEYGGVPFHAWTVVKGEDPIGEARMAAEVLANGARSLVLDLEPSDGGSFWQGTPESALAFGAELRRLQPNAFVSFAPDPRPWQVEAVPAREFATFCNEVAPQSYWPMFNNAPTFRLLRERGYDIDAAGMTPEFVLDMVHRVFADYRIPVKPVGSGSQGPEAWDRFVQHAQDLGMPAVSVWRFGTASAGVWDVLNNKKPLPSAYYGPDWTPRQLVASAPQAPKGLPALPDVAPAENTRVTAIKPREATSPLQGVAADASAASTDSPSPFDFRVRQAGPTKKSFWANLSGAFR